MIAASNRDKTASIRGIRPCVGTDEVVVYASPTPPVSVMTWLMCRVQVPPIDLAVLAIGNDA